MATAVVSKTRLFEQSSSASANYSKTKGDNGYEKDEVLSSVGAEDLDASSYQVANLEEIEFNWEGSKLDMDAVFRPSINTPFSPATFDDLSIEGLGSVENPIVLGEEQNRENSLPSPSTTDSVRPTEPPRLQRNPASRTRIENVPDSV